MDLKIDKMILSSKYPCRIYSKLRGLFWVFLCDFFFFWLCGLGIFVCVCGLVLFCCVRSYFTKKFYLCTDIWDYMKLTNMKISPNSPPAQSSFNISSQGELTVSTKLTGVISMHLCDCLSSQIGVKLLHIFHKLRKLDTASYFHSKASTGIVKEEPQLCIRELLSGLEAIAPFFSCLTHTHTHIFIFSLLLSTK